MFGYIYVFIYLHPNMGTFFKKSAMSSESSDCGRCLHIQVFLFYFILFLGWGMSI